MHIIIVYGTIAACTVILCCVAIIFYREMYHARRWFEDSRFFAPMAETPCGAIFINDFVQFQMDNRSMHGRVNQFYFKVQ